LPGYHELTYLHPKRFSPDPKVLKKLDLKPKERFTIIRFVSWGASHDIGHKGLSMELKVKAVKEFEKHGKVFISSERPLPKELERYRYSLPPEEVHSLMSYATLLYGESATMASECSMLGTHSIYLDNEGRGYTDEQERVYGLVKNFSESREDQVRSIDAGVQILTDKGSKEIAAAKTRRLLQDKIDVTAFMVKLVKDHA
jgi:hypothetical protein